MLVSYFLISRFFERTILSRGLLLIRNSYLLLLNIHCPHSKLDDPVTTCRKILRWRQCLEMPAETKAQLSPECIDFLSCLLAGPESRIGSSKNGSEVESGFKQVVQHPWYRGFDWDGYRDREGPLLPSGSREFPELLEYLK